MSLPLIRQLNEGYTAYVVANSSRKSLKDIFPPKFPEFIGHHITYKFPAEQSSVPSSTKDIFVVGYAMEDGLEALVVSINGKTQRPDGSVFHITWSLDRSKGKKPVDSNKLVKKGYTKIDPIKIEANPEYLK